MLHSFQISEIFEFDGYINMFQASSWLRLTAILSLACFVVAQYDYQTPFNYIYANKVWNANGPLSGAGSEPCKGLEYLLYLQHLIDKPTINRIVEIGFGDWEMMQHILLEHKSYIGFEVVEQIRRPSGGNKEYRIVKGLRDVNETGDLLIVRDVMQHWPTPEIDYFIENILPNFRYALLTNDYQPGPTNHDISPGGYRPINLDKIKNQKVAVEINYNDGHNLKRTILVTNPNPFP